MNVDEILLKHNAVRNSYYPPGTKVLDEESKRVRDILNNYEEKGYPPDELLESSEYVSLKKKWSHKVSEGFNGFELAQPCPIVWYKIIDEFLDYVNSVCPSFEIVNMKIKYGGLSMTLLNITDTIREEVRVLEHALFDERLIY